MSFPLILDLAYLFLSWFGAVAYARPGFFALWINKTQNKKKEGSIVPCARCGAFPVFFTKAARARCPLAAHASTCLTWWLSKTHQLWKQSFCLLKWFSPRDSRSASTIRCAIRFSARSVVAARTPLRTGTTLLLVVRIT